MGHGDSGLQSDTWKAEARGTQGQGQPQQLRDTVSK